MSNNIEFEISDPYLENWKFVICIDRIDYENEKIDSKYIYANKFFCFFKLPELDIPKIDNLMSSKNVGVMGWLKLYANSLKERYRRDWEGQPKEIILTVESKGLPTLEKLRNLKNSRN